MAACSCLWYIPSRSPDTLVSGADQRSCCPPSPRGAARKAPEADGRVQARSSLHLPPRLPLTPSPPPPPWPREFLSRLGASGQRAGGGAGGGCFSATPPLSKGVFIDELPRKPPPKMSQKGLDNPSPTTSRMLPPFQTQSSHTQTGCGGEGRALEKRTAI